MRTEGEHWALAVACHARRMDRGESLRLARRLMAAAAPRLAAVVGDAGDVDAQNARIGLTGARAIVDSMINFGHWWIRRALDTVVYGTLVWAGATLSRDVFGLGTGWTITIALVPSAAVAWVHPKICLAVIRAIERRRERRTRAGDVWVPAGLSTAAELLGLLRLARTALAATVEDRPRAAGVGGLVRAGLEHRWLHDYQQRWRWAGTAERCLCQSIVAIEQWLAAAEETA